MLCFGRVTALNVSLVTVGLLAGAFLAIGCDIVWHTFNKPLRLAFVERARRYDATLQEAAMRLVNPGDYKFTDALPDRLDYAIRDKEWMKLFIDSEFLKFRPDICAPSMTKLARSGGVLWDTEYCTTGKGYRKVPALNESGRSDRFLAFVGCSFTFGVGVSDSETLPAQVSRKLPDYHVYNFGMPAVSLAEFLADVKLNPQPIWHDVQENHGIFIYYFLDAHIRRFARTISSSNYVIADRRPVFVWLSEQLDPVFEGRAGDVHPFTTKAKLYLNRSAILRSLHLDYPIIDNLTISRYTSVVSAFRNETAKRYPHSKFAVLLDPTLDAYPTFADGLKRRGIEVIDYAPLDFERVLGAGTSIPYDGHPTADYYRLLSEILTVHLKERGL